MSFKLIIEDSIFTSFSETGGRTKTSALEGEKRVEKERLLQALSHAAATYGGTVEQDRRSNMNSIHTTSSGPKYQPVEVREIVEIVTYGFASAAALAAFVRNVLAILVDYGKLRESSASAAKQASEVKVQLAEDEITVRDGEEAIEKIEAKYPEAKQDTKSDSPRGQSK